MCDMNMGMLWLMATISAMMICVVIWKVMEYDNNLSRERALKRLAEEPKANPWVDRDIVCIDKKIGGT